MLSNQTTELIITICKGQIDTVESLLANGANVHEKDSHGHTALLTTAGMGPTPILNVLLDHGADINESTAEGWTPLLFAVLSNDLEKVKILLENGADINAKENEYGFNALEWALNEKLYGIVRILLEYGVDVNNCNNSCKLRLMKNAKRLGFPEIAEMLKRKSQIKDV